MFIQADLLRQAWQTKGWLACVLWPITLLSRIWWYLNEQAYRVGWRHSIRLPVPVLVVGNVVVGGTGKTPIVMHLARYFQGLGWQVGVITRGHGVDNAQAQEVRRNSAAAEVGDEALLVKQHCKLPVFIGRQRALAAQALLKAYPRTQLIISDDGLQHHALQHDIAVCVFDDRGVGNGWLLPAGPLREPWPRRAQTQEAKQYLVHTGHHAFEKSQPALRQLAAQAVNGRGQTRTLDSFQGQAVQALAAIAQPELFFQALQAQGLTLAATQALPDHAPLHAWKPTRPEELLCTEKDAVKLWPHFPQAWAVPLHCQLPEDLLAQLLEDVQGLSSRHG
jgi:tetraacyldisaccharide 4'-kinase